MEQVLNRAKRANYDKVYSENQASSDKNSYDEALAQKMARESVNEAVFLALGKI